MQNLPGKPSNQGQRLLHYTRDLFTLVGQVEVLKLPRIRKGDFSPQKLLSEIGLAGAFQCLPFVLSA